MKKSLSLIALTCLFIGGTLFSSCEKEEDLNKELTLSPGLSKSITSIFPKINESNLTNFTSDNYSVVSIYKGNIETLKPGKTKIHNGKCVADITVEPYKGIEPYSLPEGIKPFVSESEVLELMGNSNTPQVGAAFYRYTPCRTFTYTTSTQSISYYFDEMGNYTPETRKLVFIVIDPLMSPTSILAYLLTNYDLEAFNSSFSVVDGNGEFRGPDNWTIDTPKMPDAQPWQYIRYIAPGY